MIAPRAVAIITGQLVVGGAERQLYLWLANLDRDKFNPVVLSLHPNHEDYWEEPIINLGIPLLQVPQSINRLQRLSAIVRLLRPFKPELIHGWHFFASAYAGLAARYFNVPSIGGIRSSYPAEQRSLESFLVQRFCDAVVANSRAAAQGYRVSLGDRKQAVFTVPNAVVDSFTSREAVRDELSARYNLPFDKIWICLIGRMDPQKRFDLALEITARLKSSRNNFHFVLIGDGPEKVRLKNLAWSLGIEDCVSFLGEVPNAADSMKGMDIFCFPSTSEGLPNVIMEAAAAGLPVVAWKLPFIEELLPENTMSLLSPLGDLDSMLIHLSELLSSQSLRNSIGLAARDHVIENFGIDQYIREMTCVYDSVLEVSK